MLGSELLLSFTNKTKYFPQMYTFRGIEATIFISSLVKGLILHFSF